MKSHNQSGSEPLMPAMRQQLRQALLKYRLDNNLSWYAYHIEIKEKLGLGESDKRLDLPPVN